MPKKETIIVFGAHSDDFVIGAGGTIAKYTQEGKRVLSIVFSYGEKSHVWLKQAVIKKVRAKEAMAAGKILRCRVHFFDLREGHFAEDFEKQGLEHEMLKLFEKEKPTKLFVHSFEDHHPDHKASHRLVLQLLEAYAGQPKPELYTYSVWNPVSFRTRYPALYVNVSATFAKKLKALQAFRSQRLHIIYPFFLLLFRAVINGIRIRTWCAERFFRIQ